LTAQPVLIVFGKNYTKSEAPLQNQFVFASVPDVQQKVRASFMSFFVKQ
jgi:hypothetical protein